MIVSDSTDKPSTLAVQCHDYETNLKLTQKEILQRISKKRYMPTGDLVEFPALKCKDDLVAWIARVEEDLMTGGIPRSQWADAAIPYLAGYEPVNMLQRARRMEAGGLDIWTWEDFQESLSQVLGKVPIQRLDLGFAY
jgi:hypothetical protein